MDCMAVVDSEKWWSKINFREVSGQGVGGGEVLNLRNTSGLTLFGMKFIPTTPFAVLFACPSMYVVVPAYSIL